MVITFHARRLRTLGQFTAPDPWNANRPTAFSIEEYVMMPSGATQAVDSSQYIHRAGLRSEVDGSQRMLPESLIELWRRGQVPAEHIPGLMRAIESRLTKDDYNLILHQSPMKTVVLPLIAVFVVIVLVGLFAPVDGGPLSLPVALAVATGFSLFIGAIFWMIRQTARSRRAGQMKWLLAAQSGVAGPVPEGRAKGTTKMFFKLFGLMLLLGALTVGGMGLWFKYNGRPSIEPVVSSNGDIEMPVEILRSQQAEGVAMLVIVPTTGEQVTITIPPNVVEGTRLRLPAKGATSPTGGRGDLYLKVRVHY